MIRYALACPQGHAFESWFRSSGDFDAQEKGRLISCPVCGAADVTKQIMAPQVARTDLAPEASAPAMALMDEPAQQMRAMIAELHRQLATSSEDVGTKFAEEARKIHYGETDERAIHGHATGEEAQALAEEGISFLPVPSLPDERN